MKLAFCTLGLLGFGVLGIWCGCCCFFGREGGRERGKGGEGVGSSGSGI